MTAATHPAADRLAAFHAGKLAPAEHAEVEAHVLACDECCRLLRGQGDDSLLRLAREAGSPETPALVASSTVPPAAPPQPPSQYTAAAPRPVPASVPVPTAGMPAELADHPRYRVVAFLGAGGMGEVYKAEHKMMERTVALKVINRSMVSAPDAVDRFLREVRAAAKLQHANIVSAYDAEQAGDLHFLVMEFVDGVNLATLVARKGPLPIRQAAHFTRQAAMGLQAAFEQGMVHRDIKPHNLMVTRKGQVKILDFGLARFARQTSDATMSGGAGSVTGGLTGASVIMGTPDFLAPEQARDSRKVDHRADIYALGCTLYFLLTGRVPFPEGTVIEKFFKHWEEQAKPVTEIRPDVPADLEAVVNRMMAKAPEDRYQTPAEVSAALAPFAAGGSSAVSGAVPRILPVAPLGPLAPAAPMVLSVPDDEVDAPTTADEAPAAPTRTRRKRRKKQAAFPWVRVAAIAAVALAALAVLAVAASQLIPRGSSPVVAATKPEGVKPGGPVVPAGRTPRVLVVVPKDVYLPDFGPVRETLTASGITVVTGAAKEGPIEPMKMGPRSGPAVPIDVVLDGSVRADSYDGIVFVGGDVWEFIGDNPAAANASVLITEAKRRKKLLAAICVGENVLIKAGALDGKRASAGHPGYIQADGSKVMMVDESVVMTDTNIITAGKHENAFEFAEAVTKALGRTPVRPTQLGPPGGGGDRPPPPPGNFGGRPPRPGG